MSAIWFAKTNVDNLPAVELETELAIDRFSRLAECVLPGSGPIAARVALDKRADGIVLLTCQIRGTLKVECQRCLAPMQLGIEDELRLALLAKAGDEVKVPADYEALIVPDRELRLADLVEDEVLLDLPLVARHGDGQCRALIDGPDVPDDGVADTTKPFAGLADLMRGGQ